MSEHQFSTTATGKEGFSPPRADTCYLCGLPIGAGETASGSLRRFCCPGCRQVFLILSASTGDLPPDFRTTELYRACVEAGIVPVPGNTPSPSAADVPAWGTDTPALEFVFKAGGMWCPACGWLIEEVLKKTSGVLDPHVSFFTDTVRVRYLPHRVTPSEIMSRVAKLGYPVSPPEGEIHRVRAKQDLLVRLGVAAILTMNAMMLSTALYFGFIRVLNPTTVAYFSYPLLVMTGPVVFYAGMPILRKAWAGIRYGSVSMDTLVAVSALAAFFYSVAQIARGSIHLYFDTAAMLVTIVLLGRYIEMHARERVVASVTAHLDEIGPQKVRLREGRGERWVSASAVRPGDSFVVRAGERLALDGVVKNGTGLLDQSVLTGEPRPVAKNSEGQVMAGSLLTEGELEVVASRPAEESTLRRMTDLVTHALDRRSRGEQLADRTSRLFVPAVLAVAGFTGIIMRISGASVDEILLRCLTILLISCPCTLGIAIPLVKVAMVGLGRKKGILIKNPDALDRITKLDTMVFDKTGTVTEGCFTLRHVISKDLSDDEALSMVAAIEAGSSHFLAGEIVRRARCLGIAIAKASDIEELGGLGITGTAGGKTVFAGNRRLLTRCGAGLPDYLDHQAREWEQAGMTVVFFGSDSVTKGFFVFGDREREGAKELVDRLRKRGLRLLLLSGDGEETTEAVARRLGISDFLGQRLPHEKAETIERLRLEGHVTGMVGDGINDAGAMAAADVAIAVGSGNDVMKEAADLIIPGGRPGAIIDAFALSALCARTTRQNLSFAFLYNLIAVPVAAAGLLNPLIAVIAMFMSSLTVIGNALRVSREPGSR